MHKSLFIVFSALIFAGSCHAANNDALVEDLELLEIIREVHRSQENTGFVFMMSHRGETVLTDYAGYAVVEHKVPMTVDSRFPVMSITKAFTGLALAVASKEGLVELDEPISTYLPDYQGEGADRITLRQLATHLSGIPHTGHPDRRDLYVRHFDSANDSRYVYEDRPLAFAPGSAYGYSSSGYNLIAAVIEKLSGLNYKTYVREKLLGPLALENTDFDNVLKPVDRRVRNYSFVDVWAQPWRAAETMQEVPTWDFSYNLGGGNMYADAGDLMALGQALMRRKGLGAAIWSLALQRFDATAELSPWSLGWIHGQDEQSRRTIYITGATPGVQAALYVYPQEEIVFVALANCWGKNSAGADLVIGAPQRIVDAYLKTL